MHCGKLTKNDPGIVHRSKYLFAQSTVGQGSPFEYVQNMFKYFENAILNCKLLELQQCDVIFDCIHISLVHAKFAHIITPAYQHLITVSEAVHSMHFPNAAVPE
jgi:hypothetical protein